MEATQRVLKNPGRSYFVTFLAKFFFSILTCTELYYFAAYLTDTALLATSVVALVQTATTAIDTIFSFFYGVMMEKIGDKMPWGSVRSWLLVGPPIATVFFIFNFVRLSDNDLTAGIIIIIFFIIAHVVWSIAECAMNATTILLTDDVAQRANLSINLGRGTQGSSLVFGYVAGFFLNTLFVGNPLAYAYMIIIFGILYWIGFILLFIETKGTEPTREEKRAQAERAAKVAALSTRHASVGESYKAVFTSKNGIIIMLGIMLGYCATFMGSGMMYYYMVYCLDGGAALMGTFMSIRGLIGLLGGVFFIPALMKMCKGNKKLAYIISYVLMGVGMLVPWLTAMTNAWVYCIVAWIFSFISGGGTMIQVAMMGDIGIELTYKHNKELKSFMVTFMALPLKISLILRSVLISAALVSVNYVAGMEITEKVMSGFRFYYLGVPAIFSFVVAAITLIYKLPEAKVTEMVEVNNQRAAEDAKMVEEAIAKMG